MKIDKLKRLKSISCKLEFPITIVTDSGESNAYEFKDVQKYEKMYFINNGNLMYVHEGEAYIVPLFDGMEEILLENGFEFCEGQLPWEKISDEQEDEEKKFESVCLEYARRNELKAIPEEILEYCYYIPNDGETLITVLQATYEDGYLEKEEVPITIFPMLVMGDENHINRVGKYVRTGSNIKFVNADGRTYFAMYSEEMEAELVKRGFKADILTEGDEGSFFLAGSWLAC